MLTTGSRIGYAPINGLFMYYEVHGQGRPLVLLHGELMTIDGFGALLPALAQSRRVIAVELEGHGRTADLDRPLHPTQLAEDVAGLLKHLRIEQADFIGFNLGGAAVLHVASRYPELLRRLVVASIPSGKIAASRPSMTPEMPAGTELERAYREVAPNPNRWPILVDKVQHVLRNAEGWSVAELRSISAPVLLVASDADVVRPECAPEVFRLFGGAREAGEIGGLPEAQLALVPGMTHCSLLERPDLLLPVVLPFLDAGATEE